MDKNIFVVLLLFHQDINNDLQILFVSGRVAMRGIASLGGLSSWSLRKLACGGAFDLRAFPPHALLYGE